MIRVYTQVNLGSAWWRYYQGRSPLFVCVLGFTHTGLIPGISAAGATPDDRQYTAIADAEFLVQGPEIAPKYPLPPLNVGVSPVLISRAVVEDLGIPVKIFNAGLPIHPVVPAIDLGGTPAQCLTTGKALELGVVNHLLSQGLCWGEQLAASNENGYLICGECVVGGTTTALAVLTGLGFNAIGKVNSSHPNCNHAQKWELVKTGLQAAGFLGLDGENNNSISLIEPLSLVAAVGDPMQITIAGMAIAASRKVGVLLAGGTQMLAVYALSRAIANYYSLEWYPEKVVVGTTRWVAEDPTGDTVGLAREIGQVPLLATQLNFANSRYPQLQVYERGFVKEGMGAGGCAIAAHLYQNWNQNQLLQAIESLLDRC